MSIPEKKVYYMGIARNQIILADFAKSHKFKYQQSTNDIINKFGSGEGIIPFNEMEYAVKNETSSGGMMYLMLIEKGYYQPKAFRCLERMKQDFEKFFDRHQIANARYLSLNKEFEGPFERIYVGSVNAGRIQQRDVRQDRYGYGKRGQSEEQSGRRHGQPDSER